MTEAIIDPARDAVEVRRIGPRTEAQLTAAMVEHGPGSALDAALRDFEVVGVRRIELARGEEVPPTCRPTVGAPGEALQVVVTLRDLSGHNGQLRVAPRGHHEPTVRAVGEPVAARRGLRTLPLAAGEGLLLHDGVVWSTYPNHTDEPTVLLVATLLADDTEPVLFRRTDGRLEQTRVSPTALGVALATGALPDHGWSPATTPRRTTGAPPPSPLRMRVINRLTPAIDGVRHAVADPAEVARTAADRARPALTRAAAPIRIARSAVGAARAVRERGGAAGETLAEVALTVADANRDRPPPGDPAAAEIDLLAGATEVRLEAIRTELEGVIGGPGLAPVEVATGAAPAAGAPAERRLVLMDEGRWVERSIEWTPSTCDFLRGWDGLVAAFFVALDGPGSPQPSADVFGGVRRTAIALDSDGSPAAVADRRSDLPLTPGHHLIIDQQAPAKSSSSVLDLLARRCRSLHPRSHWAEHRLMAWEGVDPAAIEPPEGVVVEDYTDFASGGQTPRSMLSSEGRRALIDSVSVPAIMRIVALNNRLVSHHLHGTRALWDPQRFDWVPRLEAAWQEVREEAEQLLASGQWVPTVREVAGVASEQGRPAVGSGNQWRNYILYHRGQWMDWNCRQSPRTAALVKSIPELNFAFFSILEPHGHITRHRGPNRGALRYHLGVLIPDPPESCSIEINGIEHHWYPGQTLMFDLVGEHEVWNRSDQPRVLLMCEVNTPLPPALAVINRVTQAVYSELPPFRRMKSHLRGLEVTQRRPQPSGSEGHSPS